MSLVILCIFINKCKEQCEMCTNLFPEPWRGSVPHEHVDSILLMFPERNLRIEILDCFSPNSPYAWQCIQKPIAVYVRDEMMNCLYQRRFDKTHFISTSFLSRLLQYPAALGCHWYWNFSHILDHVIFSFNSILPIDFLSVTSSIARSVFY